MRRVMSSRPSPAIVVGVLALVAALAGTAAAGPDASTSALSKKRVKKIATKQIEKLAPSLSVANADALGGKPPSAYAASDSEPYREIGAPGEPSFENGWGNFGPGTPTSAAAFYKDPLSVVHLRGVIVNSPASPTVAFTLPPGYRPSEYLVMPTAGAGASGSGVAVRPTGEVVPSCTGGGGCAPGLDGLTFRVP